MDIENKELFRGKYRIRSSRCQAWDYSSYGFYFVTICTKNRQEFFGEIRNGIMGLNAIGCMASQFWQDIPDHFNNVILDEWVVMPNHVHGIIFLRDAGGRYGVGGAGELVGGRDVALQRLYDDDKNNKILNFHFSNLSPKSGSLSVVIRSFKAICARTIHETYPHLNFFWQPRFHDHIIRNENELNRIREYIRNNPRMWHRDRNNPESDLLNGWHNSPIRQPLLSVSK